MNEREKKRKTVSTMHVRDFGERAENIFLLFSQIIPENELFDENNEIITEGKRKLEKITETLEKRRIDLGYNSWKNIFSDASPENPFYCLPPNSQELDLTRIEQMKSEDLVAFRNTWMGIDEKAPLSGKVILDRFNNLKFLTN